MGTFILVYIFFRAQGRFGVLDGCSLPGELSINFFWRISFLVAKALIFLHLSPP